MRNSNDVDKSVYKWSLEVRSWGILVSGTRLHARANVFTLTHGVDKEFRAAEG